MPDEHKPSNLPEEENLPSEPENDQDAVYSSAEYMASESAGEADMPSDTGQTDDTDALMRLDETPEDADATPPPPDKHDMPTMPIPPESNLPDPKKTLPGSGGLDPNPDFAPDSSEESGYTVPHIVPPQYTMVHIPGEQHKYPPPPPPPPVAKPSQYPTQQRRPRPPEQPQSPSPYAAQPQYTQPAPQQAQPQYVPPPPQQQQQQPAPAQRGKLPRRKNGRRRKILGCSPGCLVALIGVFVTFCGGLTLITAVLASTLGSQLEQKLQQQVAQVDTYTNFQSTFFYDRNGTQLYEAFGEGRRTNVNYSEFPQDLVNATVSIEDGSFWSNPGFEVQATGRALLQYAGLASGASGGSTITQQLVRNVLFSYEYRSERSIQRKIEEIMLSALLTQRKTKQEILQMYLNEIYYGDLAYGAEAAAETYFGKHVSELTLGEAALLAGLPQAPADLDPLNADPDVQAAVSARWREVLDRMVTEGYITRQKENDTLSQGLTFVTPEAPLNAPHFTVYAQQEFIDLMQQLGYTPDQVARGGWKVYTTVDLRINDLAQSIAQQQVANLTANNVTNAAVLVLKPITNEIMAMVGSVDYHNDAIDGRVNVTISARQPGSTMKPFTYSAAMEQGFTAGDIIWDVPIQIADYQPHNYDLSFHGPVRMRTALANSLNIEAVQTLRRVGVDNLLTFMQRFGVESLGNDAGLYGLSLTLGGGEITLLELTRGYTVFANEGSLVPTTSILCVLDSSSNIVYQYESGCPQGQATSSTVDRTGLGRQVLDPRIAFVMRDILSDNVARSMEMGANSPLNTPGIVTSVKTGTTTDFKDNWTVGFTHNVAVGVWVGNSNGDPMVNSTGLTGASPIWNAVINGIYNNPDLLAAFASNGQLQPDQNLPPAGMSLRRLCAISQLKDPATDCGDSISEWFLDSPAGIPDADGNLQYPPPPPGDSGPPASGPYLQLVEPSIYRVVVHPIPPDIASAIHFSIPAGQSAPPPPLYCQVPVELAASDPAARSQLFIAPPPFPDTAVQAEQWARNNGYAFLPTIACSQDLINASGSGGAGNVITAVITSPVPNQVITDAVPIIGTVQFASQQAQFYKLEIIGGQFGDWVTIGSTHNNPVVNGQLETLPGPPGLQPGSYQLRLVVVGLDGNYVQAPYVIPFVVQ